MKWEKYTLSTQLTNMPFGVEMCCFIYFLMNKIYVSAFNQLIFPPPPPECKGKFELDRLDMLLLSKK